MKIRNVQVVIIISVLLFIIPFFWLKPGYVDLGGDAGRFLFIDPLTVAANLYQKQTITFAPSYAALPYLLFMSLIAAIFPTPTLRIAVEHGIQLSVAFVAVYLLLKELFLWQKTAKFTELAALIGSMGYISLITKSGWATSLETQNQVFLNPLVMYLFSKYLRTSLIRYALLLLSITLLYSFNFGFSSMPQILSFYPFAITFILLGYRFILKKSLPWVKLLIMFLAFLGLHAFHLIPLLGLLTSKGNTVSNQVFSEAARFQNGLFYFDANRAALGKISENIFQPAPWLGTTILIFVIPIITFSGFLVKRSKLQALAGVFVAVTLYFVTANITLLGAKLYRLFFYIPGFSMFRSFNDKWYWVFAFFMALLFGISFQALISRLTPRMTKTIVVVVAILLLVRVTPFLKGDFYNTSLYQSNNVSPVFVPDKDLLDSINTVRKIQKDGNVLTLPIAFPYYQVFSGRTT